MFAYPRFGPLVVGALCLALSASASAADKKDALSRLSKIGVTTSSDDVAVAIDGTKAPDFTSFTMTEPFRVVVDWAGSRLDGAKSEQAFDRGLIRKITTKQFDSEAEKISRVTIELARKTAYRVEASGTHVVVHFVPVATPIPEPAPAPEPKPEPVVAKKDKPYVPEGPLTEPDVPVPEEAPVIVAKVEPKKPAPKPAVKVAPKKVTPPKAAPKPAPVLARAPAPKPAPAKRKRTVKVDPVAAVIAPDAPAVPDGAPLTEPTFVEPAPKPKRTKAKTTSLAKFVPTEAEPAGPAPKRVQPAKIATPTVQPPRAAKPTRRAAPRTQQLASKPKIETGWQPPSVQASKRALPVVKVAQADTLDAVGSTPADVEEPVREAAPLPTRETADGNDFDPGPRVMKYIGFRQMADVSRVFVRVDGKAKYRQLQSGTNFVLELVETSVNVKNNERPLDTTYFNSPVTKIQAVPSGQNTRIEIVLRENVPVKVKRIGTTIAIDFTRR